MSREWSAPPAHELSITAPAHAAPGSAQGCGRHCAGVRPGEHHCAAPSRGAPRRRPKGGRTRPVTPAAPHHPCLSTHGLVPPLHGVGRTRRCSWATLAAPTRAWRCGAPRGPRRRPSCSQRCVPRALSRHRRSPGPSLHHEHAAAVATAARRSRDGARHPPASIEALERSAARVHTITALLLVLAPLLLRRGTPRPTTRRLTT